ncbi:MAG TPA: signal recognition particle-docking protein FtsY [Candidatus Bathyarchaeota archaeon]|nr:signal recognition particle-docking protein FtsY [Candidatus Bathyarchaeota archaeon]
MFEKLREGLNKFIENLSKTELKIENVKPVIEDLKFNLIESNVALPVAENICSEIAKRIHGMKVSRFEDKHKLIRNELREIILKVLNTGSDVDLLSAIKEKNSAGEPFTIVFLGINGTGKTTSIAKMAYLLKTYGFTVVMACSDTFRAGAIEQIEEHARRLKLRVIKHKYGSDPAAVAFDSLSYARARGIDAVLIDTAGRMQTDRNLMDELNKIIRTVEPDFRMLVVDALTGNDAVNQAEEFDEKVGVDGFILTKVDADVKGGTALSIVYTTGKPILYIGTGQRYEDLQKFDANLFIEKILG